MHSLICAKNGRKFIPYLQEKSVDYIPLRTLALYASIGLLSILREKILFIPFSTFLKHKKTQQPLLLLDRSFGENTRKLFP